MEYFIREYEKSRYMNVPMYVGMCGNCGEMVDEGECRDLGEGIYLCICCW